MLEKIERPPLSQGLFDWCQWGYIASNSEFYFNASTTGKPGDVNEFSVILDGKKVMTFNQFYKVSDTKLVITLPAEFNNKRVYVTIDDQVATDTNKIELMKLAANDPLFLLDLDEVNRDVDGLEQETL